MVWSERNRSSLSEDDPEIIIGSNHPISYAFTIMCFLKRFGYCKVHVHKTNSFVLPGRHNPGRVVRLVEQWETVLKFLVDGTKSVRVSDTDESENYFTYTLDW